jgi:hypothetical protein
VNPNSRETTLTKFSAEQVLTTAHSHRPDFDVVLRKLISKMQACLQSIDEPSMLRPAYFLCGIGVTPTCSSAVYGAP